MSPYSFSPKQTRVLEITCLVIFIAAIIFGVVYQIMGWKLEGGHLILVCILVINYVNLIRSQLTQANARIDELEKRLAASPGR
jgi:hypothetical protein